MLASLPVVTALAGAGLRLPRREEIEVETNPYLTSNRVWYIKTENEATLKYFHQYADLSEQSLNDLVNDLRDRMTGLEGDFETGNLSVKP
jgi:hypothetical protein